MLNIITYSEKAIAVIGNTKAHKDELRDAGGKFNPYLKCGAGWIFSARHKAKIEALVHAINGFASDDAALVLAQENAMADLMAERAGVGSSLSPFERGNY
jgi:hypothetical protein